MIGTKKLLLAAASAVLLSGCSNEDNSAASTPDATSSAALRALEGQGVTIHGSLDVPGGLNAFGASAGTQGMAVYIMPDSDYAVIGTLIDAEGNPVAEEALRQIVSEPMEQGAWDALEASSWVQDGDPSAERVIYTFTDANCPFCNELWHAARPWVEADKVQLRHVMVGVIRADSAGKAATILEADDPEAAMTQNVMNHAQGGVEPIESISAETTEKLSENVQLMQQLGFSGTPGMVARAADGSLVLRPGVPRGPALEELFGPL
ncbi:thiol:disulfide interchange protein DsbG [Pelagibacterium luteolum]|uniref:Thiol:disulfide interchange protein n=1 Tax=Pelagibacterium luteolum TaxID=440168 RepID=A0A1G7Z2X7_9HYPH|nr:thiol:disulfide interchange protein DsbG [Pelagibacterium luteolum]SDH03024.1 Thiol:disulfide interchange protein DsbC [Pelagibacterium luteolum]